MRHFFDNNATTPYNSIVTRREDNEKVRRCADESLVPCSRERCRDVEPINQDLFESDEELQNNCLAYPKPGENDTCMRPENIAKLWILTGRAKDPTTGVSFCPRRRPDGSPERYADGRPVYEEVWRGGLSPAPAPEPAPAPVPATHTTGSLQRMRNFFDNGRLVYDRLRRGLLSN
ncbi:hypothetical protein EBX93_08375 [bacterium]|nr:hypothetical protein [bacterium]